MKMMSSHYAAQPTDNMEFSFGQHVGKLESTQSTPPELSVVSISRCMYLTYRNCTEELLRLCGGLTHSVMATSPRALNCRSGTLRCLLVRMEGPWTGSVQMQSIWSEWQNSWLSCCTLASAAGRWTVVDLLIRAWLLDANLGVCDADNCEHQLSCAASVLASVVS